MLTLFEKLKAKISPPRRQYPIKGDECGQSACFRCFCQYDKGYPPKDIYASIGISLRTARRYHADWGKYPPNFAGHYWLMKQILKHGGSLVPPIIEGIGRRYNMPREEVEERLAIPWGLHSLMLDRWPNFQGKRPWTWETAIASVLRELTGWPTPLIEPEDKLRALAWLQRQQAEKRYQARIMNSITRRGRIQTDTAASI